MFEYLTPTLFLATWAGMFFFFRPRFGESWIYQIIAPPSLIAGTLSFLFGGSALFSNVATLFTASAILYAGLRYMGWWPSGSSSGGDDHRRGAKIADYRVVAKLAKKQNPGGIEWDGVPIPRQVENRHFLLIGSTGTGKSVAIKTMLDTLRQRGDKAVLADSGGEFVARYAKAGDTIINPFDDRCANWSPLAEMDGPWDADLIAKSLIPTGDAQAAEWNHYAQQFLSALLLRLWEQSGTNGELARLATAAPLDELRDLLEGMPAAALLAKGNERMFGSVRGIVGSRLGILPYLPADAGRGGFSIRRYIAEPGKGWLYLTYRDDQLRALAPLIGSLLDVAAIGVLSLNPNETRRVWLVADELDSLGSVDGLLPFLTKSRKYGGAAVLGIQAIAQLRERYGPNGAVTLANCCGTWLALRNSDPETCDFVSKFLGDEEVRRVTSGGSDNGNSWSEQITTSRLVMPSEIQTLDVNCGYLNIAGPLPCCGIKLAMPQKREDAAAAFIPREISKPAAPVPTQVSVPVAATGAVLDATPAVASVTEPVQQQHAPESPPSVSAESNIAEAVFGDLFNR